MNATLATALPLPLHDSPPRASSRVRSAQELRTALRVSGVHRGTPDLALLDRVLRLDAQGGRVELQAGVRWDALSAYLASQSIAGAASLGTAAACCELPATAGECVARNSACPDGSPIASHVTALAVVTADGELRRAGRSHQPELFQRIIGGHGLIAATYSVTLCVDSLVRAFSGATPPVTLDSAPGTGATGESVRLMVPPSNLHTFLAALRQAFDDFRLPIHALRVRKAMPDDVSLLRWATEELALVDVRLPARLTLPAQVAATQVRRALIAAALTHGGRFDLATGFDAGREQVEAAYPKFKSFLAEKRRHDPQERLGGAFYAHYRSLFERESCDVRWTPE